MENRKISLKDGLFKQNIVFMSGLLIAPVIACATTLMKSLAICMVFSVVSFFTILICRAVPRKIAYTIRVIIYSLTATVIYMPAVMLAAAMAGMIFYAHRENIARLRNGTEPSFGRKNK